MIEDVVGSLTYREIVRVPTPCNYSHIHNLQNLAVE